MTSYLWGTDNNNIIVIHGVIKVMGYIIAALFIMKTTLSIEVKVNEETNNTYFNEQ